VKRDVPLTRPRIVAALQRIDDDADAALIEKHANAIHGAMFDAALSCRARGFDIGVDNDGIPYARPKTSTAGPARELRDLATKCRKAATGKISREEWITIWTALPARIRTLWRKSLIIETVEGARRRRTIDRNTLAGGFIAGAPNPGFTTIAPKPEIALPSIETALAKITAAPGSKKRVPNAVEAKAIETSRAAYQEITGNQGGRVIARGKLAGKHHALRREIDLIFGTALFDVKDSKRFR
jgi:hypothetical protein